MPKILHKKKIQEKLEHFFINKIFIKSFKAERFKIYHFIFQGQIGQKFQHKKIQEMLKVFPKKIKKFF